LNANNLTVDPATGRVSFGGLSSGTDWTSVVNNIIAAKHIPIDTLTQKITDNQAKVAALQSLQTKVSSLQTAVSSLRGAITVDGTGNVFKAKQTFASTTRADGLTPSAAASLIGVSVTNAAALGTHSIEVRRIATSEKVGSATFANQSSALGFSGSFAVTGNNAATITVSATDTLQDIRDRINNANTGTNATGVSANIVQVSSTQFILVLTNTTTGQALTLGSETGGILNSLGISADGGTTFNNELQKAQSARFMVDGITDPTRYESGLLSSSSTLLNTVATNATFPGSFDIKVGASTVMVNYTAADTADSLKTKINNAITAAGGGNAVFDAGTTASVMTDGSGARLVINTGNGSTVSFTDTNGLLGGLGMNNDLVITRNSNTINDVIPGVTLTLFQAEEGTKINLEIDQDQSAVKTAIQGFVTAYNDLRTYVNQQSLTDSTSGQKSSDAGPLFGSTTLATVQQNLAQIVGRGVGGVSSDFSVLAQVGITFIDNNTVSDPSKKDTLVLDENKLDTAILNNPDDVRRLFTFDFSSSDPRVSLLGFNGNTQYNSSGYKLNLTSNGTSVTSANINGVANSTTVNGNSITVNDATGASGLQLLYTGTTDASNVQLDFTVGLGAQLFFSLGNMLDTTDGLIQADIKGLQDQSTQNQTRIDSMQSLLDQQKQDLTLKFNNLETALAQAQSIKDTLTQMFDAAFNNNKSN
jgi:flagellar hook-associated protein 2